MSFKYDPFGRRVEKISPTTTSIFAYDGDNLVETVNASGGEVARYAPTKNIDEPLAMQRGTTTSYYEQDAVGSVTSLSNASGALAQTYTYDSFGNQTASSGSLTNFFRYTGREFDTETNLYYYRARYYDPSVGRFINEDPRHFDAGVNFYPYVDNNPVNLVDPFGTCKESSPNQPQKCARAMQITKWLGVTATMNWAAGVLTSELPPLGAIYGGIATVETIGTGVMAVYTAYVCFQQ